MAHAYALDLLASAAVAAPAPTSAPAFSPTAAIACRALDALTAQAVAVATTSERKRLRDRLTRTLADHRRVVGQYQRTTAWPGVAQVPYEWEVGRLMRHALDTDNTTGLLAMATYLHGHRILSSAPSVPPERHLVAQCLVMSLHPDTAEAVALFRRIVSLPSVTVVLASWRNRLHDALLESVGGRRSQDGELGRIAAREGIAKALKCLSIGSPFLADFNLVPGLLTPTTDWRVVTAVVDAFLRYEASPRTPGLGPDSTYATANRLFYAVHNNRRAPESQVWIAYLDRIRYFIDLNWTRTATSHLNRSQTDVIAALAEQLAKTSVGKADVILPIMEFVRTPLSPGYRAVEQAAAHAAFGHAELERARAEAAAHPQEAAAAAAARRRAREEDTEQRSALARQSPAYAAYARIQAAVAAAAAAADSATRRTREEDDDGDHKSADEDEDGTAGDPRAYARMRNGTRQSAAYAAYARVYESANASS